MMELITRPVLLLDDGFQPLNIVSAKRALTLIAKNTVDVVDCEDAVLYQKGDYSISLPSVVRLRYDKDRKIPFKMPIVSRKNILARDNNTCMYCGKQFPQRELTMDHIKPKSKGGRNAWDNLVACCHSCNRKKDDKLLEDSGMTLLKRPRPINLHTPKFLTRSMGQHNVKWRKYLYFDNNGTQEG